MVAALLLLTRVRPLELRSRAIISMQATPPTDWATREDFALLDGAPAFSVGSGAQAVTFWQSMVASTPELAAHVFESAGCSAAGAGAGGAPQPLNEVASMCAEFLPAFVTDQVCRCHQAPKHLPRPLTLLAPVALPQSWGNHPP